MEQTAQQNPMQEGADPAEPVARKSLRPVLVVSTRNLVEHTTFIRHLLVGLANESISVAMISPPGFDLESDAPSPAAVLTHPSINLPLMEHIGTERLATQLEKLKPKLLHCLCESRAGVTRRLARRLNLPYVLMINSPTPKPHRLPISPQWCKRIVVPAETIRVAVSRALPHLAEKVRHINIGTFVDTGTICFSDPSQLASIVVAHPLDRVSDFENFLKAVKSLLADGQEFVVAIMGAGPAEGPLRQLVIELELSQIVTIVPILNPWRAVVATGDIFVQPQPLKSFSVFLLEAMAAGTAVAACWGGVDDLIIPNQTAAVFEPDSEPSIRHALKQLLDDRDTARRLATTAQEHIRARHTVSEMVEATLRTYADTQRPGPHFSPNAASTQRECRNSNPDRQLRAQ